MADYINTTNNTLPDPASPGFLDGDTIALQNGSKFSRQSGRWEPVRFQTVGQQSKEVPVTATLSDQGIRDIKAGGIDLPPQRGYLRLDTLTPDAPTITTVGAVNNATPSISPATTINYNNASLRFFGASKMSVYNSAYIGNGSSSVGLVGDGTKIWLGYFLEFELDSTAFELRLNGDFATASGLDYMMWVDGLPVSREPLKYGTSTGKWITNFTWATKRRRRITILTAALLHQIYIGKKDALFPSTRKLGRSVCVVSDSFGTGIGGSGVQSRIGSWMYRLALRLGFEDIHCACQASTGYVNDNGGTLGAGRFSSRLATEVIPVNPDTVIFMGSVNDDNGTITPAQVGAEAASCYATLAAALPNSKLIVYGPQYMDGIAHLPRDAIAAAIQSATKAAPNVVRYVPMSGWVTGTGKVGAAANNGNADDVTCPDGVHPSIYTGHMYIGDAAYSAISDIPGLAQI